MERQFHATTAYVENLRARVEHLEQLLTGHIVIDPDHQEAFVIDWHKRQGHQMTATALERKTA